MGNVTTKQVAAAKAKYDKLGLLIEKEKEKAGYKKGDSIVAGMTKKHSLLYQTYQDLKKWCDADEADRKKVDEAFFNELESELTSFAEQRVSLGKVGAKTMVKGSGTADDPFLGEDASRYTMVADMAQIAEKLDMSVHFVHEGKGYVATLRGIMESDEFDGLDDLDEAKVAPGTTKDEHYGQWKLTFEIRPKAGSKEYRGRAVHVKSTMTPAVTVTGTSSDDVKAKLVSTIDSTKSQKEIDPKSYVNIDFNVATTKDIIGHKDVIYGTVLNFNGVPTLLISATPEKGLTAASDRSAKARKHEGSNGAHAFKMRGADAIEAGLTHARYTLDEPFDFDGITAYPLKFNSEVHRGNSFGMGAPGVTVAYPTEVAEGANEDGVFEGIFDKSEKRQALEAEKLAKKARLLGGTEEEAAQWDAKAKTHAANWEKEMGRGSVEEGIFDRQKEETVTEGNRDTDFIGYDGWLDGGISQVWPEAKLFRIGKNTVAKVGNRIVGKWDWENYTGFVELEDITESDEGKARIRGYKDRNGVKKWEVLNADGVRVKGDLSNQAAKDYLTAHRSEMMEGTEFNDDIAYRLGDRERENGDTIMRGDITRNGRPIGTITVKQYDVLYWSDMIIDAGGRKATYTYDTSGSGSYARNVETIKKHLSGKTDPKPTGPLRLRDDKEPIVSESSGGNLSVNMSQMNRWKVDQDNVKYYDSIMKTKGKVQSLDLQPYKNFLDEFNIFYTASLGESKHGLSKHVKIVKGPAAGKTGYVGEVRNGAFKGAKKEYTIDLEDGSNVRCTADQLRLIKDEPIEEGVEGLGRAMMTAAAIGGATGLSGYLPNEPTIEIDGVKTMISTPQTAAAARNHSTIKLIDGKPYQVWSVKGIQYAWPINDAKQVKEGYWADAMKKFEKDSEERKGKPFEKNPLSHDKNGVYKGDKDLAGNPVKKVTEAPVQKAGTFIPKEKYTDYNECLKAAKIIAKRDYTNIVYGQNDKYPNNEYFEIKDNVKGGYRVIGVWDHSTNTGKIVNNMSRGKWMESTSSKQVTEEGWKGTIAGLAAAGAIATGIGLSPKIEVGGETYDKALSSVQAPADAKTVMVNGEKVKVWKQPQAVRKGPGPNTTNVYQKVEQANEDVVTEKSKSAKQARFMAAAAHDPKFAKKVGIKQSVAKEFNQADKGTDLLKGKK